MLDRGQAFYVPGKESFLQELFDICNLENVAAGLDPAEVAGGLDRADPRLEPRRDPRSEPRRGVDADAGRARRAKFWQQHGTLAAVKSGRVVVLNAGVLVRPGPRLVAVAEELARIVHGAP